MKAYTDIEQSKKLAETLPLESADMCYRLNRVEGGIPDYQVDLCPYQFASWIGVPCWSLAALLDYLPNNQGQYTKTLYWWDDAWHCEYVGEDDACILSTSADDAIDACVEMILKLHKLNLL